MEAAIDQDKYSISSSSSSHNNNTDVYIKDGGRFRIAREALKMLAVLQPVFFNTTPALNKHVGILGSVFRAIPKIISGLHTSCPTEMQLTYNPPSSSGTGANFCSVTCRLCRSVVLYKRPWFELAKGICRVIGIG